MNATISIRHTELAEAFTRWLKRRTVPSNFAGDEQAEEDELASLMGTLSSHCPHTEVAKWVGRVTGLIENRAQHRSWPTAGELSAACKEVNQRSGGASKAIIPDQRGDKNKLSYDELRLLEDKILPTARRWLEFPGLAHHAKQTLEYWGEKYDQA